MGFEIICRWTAQSRDEREAQNWARFGDSDGERGYLFENFDYIPSATQHLVPEAYCQPDRPVTVAARQLRERLPLTLHVAEATRRLYDPEVTANEIAIAQHHIVRFVELCERIETTTGEPVRIIVTMKM